MKKKAQMKKKEFRRLRRAELVEIIYRVQEEDEALRGEIASLRQRLGEETQEGGAAIAGIPEREQVEAERRRLRYNSRFRRTLASTVGILAVVAAVAVLISTLLFPILQVSGSSMEPTLEDNDIIVLMKGDDFETGDLIGLRYEGKVLLKRVIGGPGDYISIDEDGTVSVNGEVLDEPYVTDKSLGECDLTFPYQVPENSWFVLGDHRSVSIDSRSSVVGCIRKEQIIGKVILRIWPFSRIEWIS